MTVKNVSAAAVQSVVLRRTSDFDADGRNENVFVRTRDSVIALNDERTALGAATHGVMLSHEAKRAGVEGPSTLVTRDPFSCSALHDDVEPGVTPVDQGASIAYALGALNPGTSRSVTVAYQRI